MQAPQTLVLPMVAATSTTWVASSQVAVTRLTASVAPVLARAATGATEPGTHLLSRVGRFLVWAVGSVTLMGTCFAATSGWLRIGALGALGLLLLLPLLVLKDRVRSPLLQGHPLTQTISVPKALPSVLRSWPALGALVLSLAWSPDQRFLAGTSDRAVVLWIVSPGRR